MSGPGREVAEVAKRQADALPRPASAYAAVETIRVCFSLARALWEPLQARVMEACWVIRNEHPDEDDFNAFVAGQLVGTIEPEKAWLAAETWDGARQNRGLRELAVDRPSDALDFVAEFVRVGQQEQLKDPEGETGARALEILSSPARKRNRMLGDLLDAERAAKEQRHPDDVRTIEQQEAEIVDLRGRVDPRPTPRQTLREILSELQRIDGELAEVAERLATSADSADEALRLQLQVAADSIDGRSQDISAALLDSEAD